MLLVLLASACSFSTQGVDGEETDVDAGEVEIDAAEPIDAPPEPDAPPPGRPDAGRGGCEPVPELVACYRFENPQDPLRDESMYLNKGLAMGTLLVEGPPGEGMALGVGRGVTARVPDSASLDVPGDLTLELWVKVDTLPAAGARAGLADNNGQYGMFLGPAGEVRCAVTGVSVIGGKLEVGRWTHVACTHTAGRNRLFIDGEPVAEITANGNPSTSGTDGLAIGHDSPMDDNLDGAVDTLKVWKILRSDEQICREAGGEDCDD